MSARRDAERLRALLRLSGWHRVFHPLCGADPLTLLRLVRLGGAPSMAGAPRYAVALLCALGRAPFTLTERLADRALPLPPAPPPVVIVGHPRSGTTHLHNLLAASGAFAIASPVQAGMPHEPRSLGRLMRPVIEPWLPETRIIDQVRVTPESPTEDELALASLCGLSYFHAVYFPRRFRALYARGLLFEGAGEAEVAARMQALRRWTEAISALGGGRPPLLKNPAYTARIEDLRRLWPEVRIVHIHREPEAVFASTRRMMRRVTRELGLQPADPREIDAAILETYPRMMRGLIEAADHAPPDRFAHVAYEGLDRAPLEEVERIWRRLDLSAPEAALAGVARYLEGLESYPKARHELDSQARDAVRERWTPIHARLAAATSPQKRGMSSPPSTATA